MKCTHTCTHICYTAPSLNCKQNNQLICLYPLLQLLYTFVKEIVHLSPTPFPSRWRVQRNVHSQIRDLHFPGLPQLLPQWTRLPVDHQCHSVQWNHHDQLLGPQHCRVPVQNQQHPRMLFDLCEIYKTVLHVLHLDYLFVALKPLTLEFPQKLRITSSRNVCTSCGTHCFWPRFLSSTLAVKQSIPRWALSFTSFCTSFGLMCTTYCVDWWNIIMVLC